jgi:L-seryl-tRNA(Ser) seleniumtransferase
MDATAERLLRTIPAVGEFLNSAAGRRLVAEFGEGMTKWELRNTLGEMRNDIRRGRVTQEPASEDLSQLIAARLRRLMTADGRQAINATGILLHTGLGRAPLCEAAIAAMRVAAGNTPLQASLESGDRSLREERVQGLLQELIGCEAATVVNNNAAATMLILNTLAAGREVIVSRGQLIEIGGSFRMTDVMAQSGAVLREVGTTNRTHLRDYEAAINERTGAIIHVHTSNYRVRGFAGTPAIGELVALGGKHKLAVIDDLGSGAIVPLSAWGISDEPLVRDSLSAGVDVACFSGDKLICGPQAGIICGSKAVIEKIRKNPFARMFRVCKLTLAALEATLVEFINGTYRKNLPFYHMLDRPVAELEETARQIAGELQGVDGITAEVGEDISYIGSGSIPDEGIATRVVRVRHERLNAADLARRLRLGMPSVFGRLADRELVLDMRTLRAEEATQVVTALRAAVKGTERV